MNIFKYSIFIAAIILINIFGFLMYLGEPGLQFILTYVTIFIASIFTLIAIYIVRASSMAVLITVFIGLITLLTGMPLWLQNRLSGEEMKQLGLLCYGIGVPTQILLLLLVLINRNSLINSDL